jgi:hypothetical protein
MHAVVTAVTAWGVVSVKKIAGADWPNISGKING